MPSSCKHHEKGDENGISWGHHRTKKKIDAHHEDGFPEVPVDRRTDVSGRTIYNYRLGQGVASFSDFVAPETLDRHGEGNLLFFKYVLTQLNFVLCLLLKQEDVR